MIYVNDKKFFAVYPFCKTFFLIKEVVHVILDINFECLDQKKGILVKHRLWLNCANKSFCLFFFCKTLIKIEQIFWTLFFVKMLYYTTVKYSTTVNGFKRLVSLQIFSFNECTALGIALTRSNRWGS